ncbi:conserved hypothetical protein [Candidatus Sulfopaludibacter sp. SbA4]|nr:conserved hypothetical protein [Candidatus Sulfopaludibacter sp. SbA4]
MLGEVVSETSGKRIVRRVLGTNPPTVEVSFEDSGSVLGVPCSGFGTYESVIRADGSIFGHGRGAMATADGELITWQGSGQGKFGPGGAVSYRGMLFFQTASQKLAEIAAAPGAFEYEVDAAGNTHSKVWAWK